MLNIDFLVEQGPCKEFKAKEVIPSPAAESADNNSMYILLSGSVDVFDKTGSRKVASVAPGDVFGGREYFLGIDEFIYKAREDINVYLLSNDSFNDLSWSQPDILFEILRSAYTPPRKPLPSLPEPPAPKPAPAPAPATKPAVPAAHNGEQPAVDRSAVQAKVAMAAKLAETAKEVNNIFPPGHKEYTDKEFTMNDKLIFQKEYTCPFCKKAFQDVRVFRSKLYESRSMRFDLRRYYTDFISEWYDLLTCPHCYFTTFHNYFTDPKPIKRDAVETKLAVARSEIPVTFSVKRDINLVFTMHYLALLCCDGFPSMAKQLRAKLWGNLSWLYEDVEDKDMEKYAATQAAEAYEDVYSSSHLTPVQEQITCMSIAGMQYRAGIDNNLKRYIFLAKTKEMGDRTYSSLADDFWYELKLDESHE